MPSSLVSAQPSKPSPGRYSDEDLFGEEEAEDDSVEVETPSGYANTSLPTSQDTPPASQDIVMSSQTPQAENAEGDDDVIDVDVDADAEGDEIDVEVVEDHRPDEQNDSMEVSGEPDEEFDPEMAALLNAEMENISPTSPTFRSANNPLTRGSSPVYGGVEGGVGMRRLASGVPLGGDDSESSEDSDD